MAPPFSPLLKFVMRRLFNVNVPLAKSKNLLLPPVMVKPLPSIVVLCAAALEGISIEVVIVRLPVRTIVSSPLPAGQPPRTVSVWAAATALARLQLLLTVMVAA